MDDRKDEREKSATSLPNIGAIPDIVIDAPSPDRKVDYDSDNNPPDGTAIAKDSQKKQADAFYWNLIPFEIQEMIIQQMDIITRFRLLQCSTNTQCAVQSTSYKYSSLVALSTLTEDADMTHWTHTLLFDGFELQEKQIHKSDDVWKVFDPPSPKMMSIFVNVLSTGNVRIGLLKSNWECPSEQLAAKRLKVKRIDMDWNCIESLESKKKWLSCLDDCLKSAVLLDDWEDHKIKDPAVLQKVEQLHIGSSITITDDFLLACRATQVIADNCYFSAKTINSVIQKWIREDYPVGSKLFVLVECQNKDQPEIAVAAMLKGLTSTKKIRTHDNKLEISINMGNSEKYIELAPLNLWSLQVQLVVRRKQQAVNPRSTNWNNLPKSIKILIVEKMDIFTRVRFKVCSKENKALVEETPMYFSKLVIGTGWRCKGFAFDDAMGLEIAETDWCVMVKDKTDISHDQWYTCRRILQLADSSEAWSFLQQSLVCLANFCHVDRIEFRASFCFDVLEHSPIIHNAKEIYLTEDSYFFEGLQWLSNPRIYLDDYASEENLVIEIGSLTIEDVSIGSYFKTWLSEYPKFEIIFDELTWRIIEEGIEETGTGNKLPVVISIEIDEVKSIRCVIETGKKQGRPALMMTCDIVANNQGEQ